MPNLPSNSATIKITTNGDTASIVAAVEKLDRHDVTLKVNREGDYPKRKFAAVSSFVALFLLCFMSTGFSVAMYKWALRIVSKYL